jgi:E3 ubiquitin-protein ligase DOA10
VKTFKVYKLEREGFKAVKVGVSFPAFFLGWIWFFYKGAYSFGFGFLIAWAWYVLKSAGVDIPLEEYTTSHILTEIVGLITFLIAFIKGNEWVAKYYEEKNWKLVKVIQADNLKAAIALVENDNTND